MELYDVMRTTFAVREFTHDPLPDAVLYRILDNARFAPSGGNRQGAHIVAVRDAALRERLGDLNIPGTRRYFAQLSAGENPWNPIEPSVVPAETIAGTTVPDEFTAPFRRAAVVLVVTVDLTYVAATDQDLDRIGVISCAAGTSRNSPPGTGSTRHPCNSTHERTKATAGCRERKPKMSGVPSRQARLAHAAKHAELWNAGKREEWITSWRTIVPAEVRMFDPVGTEEKHGFDAATGDAFDMFQSILKIKMITVQVNGNEMAWVCENSFGTEPNVQKAYSIETFAWDDDGNLLIKTYYPMPETVGADSDPYAHLLDGQQ